MRVCNRVVGFVWFAVLSAGQVSAAQVSAAQARVLRVDAEGALVLDRVGVVRLQGVDVPAGGAARLRHWLEENVVGKSCVVRSDASVPGVPPAAGRPAKPGFQIGTLRVTGAGSTVNAQILEAGLAFFRTRTKRSVEQASLLAAALRAKAARAGIWATVGHAAGPAPKQRGAALGLYYKEDRFDYHEQVDRVQQAGAAWIELLLSVFVDKVDSSEIEFDAERTVSDARLRETIAYCKKLGLRVKLLPVVLIRNADDDDDWRGTLRPKDPGKFWRGYDDFLCHYLDIARETGVELFSIGSELCSLEKQHEVWPRLIQNARGRYAGWLSYSVNWDHYDVPKFWHLLDEVGMTAYFELTEDKAASYDELVTAWKRVRKEIAGVAKRLGRHIVLTELGYASQDGTNTAPWNYYLAEDKIDLQEQADCFRAFTEVMSDAPFLDGVYVFDFFENGGPKDTTYAVWGKPAFDVIKRLLVELGSHRK